ncbi:MAG: S41 family peptidase [Phycisphaerae bacterium]|jgi:carboxyl-terminal processing protease
MPKRNIVWIAVLAVIAVLLWKVPESLIRRDALYSEFGPLLDVLFQVRKNYVEEPKDETLLRGAIEGLLGQLDPYSQYFDPGEYQQFQKKTEGQFVGIGIEVGRVIPGVGLEVAAPIEGTPAYRAGIRALDRIVKIDGKLTFDLKVSDAIELIQGRPGTSVKLVIDRPGREDLIEVTITRGVITVRTVRGWARNADWEWDYLLDPEHRIGYIRVSGFEKPTGDQLDEAIKELLIKHRMRGLIIDLRDNPGGLLTEVVNIVRHFIPKGVIVTTKGRNRRDEVYEASGRNVYPDFPLVILINKGSASASEIMAGALRDHGRAILVGETSFGKSSVQETIELSNGRAIKLTTAYYYLPKGERIHGQGVVPDHIVPLTPRERTQMIESSMAVYSTAHEASTRPASQPGSGPAPPADTRPAAEPTTAPVASTRPGTSPATAPASAPARLEIVIDRQLRTALDLLKARLATRPADESAG